MKNRTLVVAIPLLVASLSLLSSACSGRSSSAGDADWSSFTTLNGPGLSSSSLDDLSSKAGFRLVLPSYIPPGISRTFLLSSQAGPVSPGQAIVRLMPDDKAPRDIQMDIQIDEHVRPPSVPATTGYSDNFDVLTIGGIDVGCLTAKPDVRWPTPAPNEGYPAELRCQWDRQELSFNVQFGWRTESGATPEVTPDRREEAIKVITSMIEDPYVP